MYNLKQTKVNLKDVKFSQMKRSKKGFLGPFGPMIIGGCAIIGFVAIVLFARSAFMDDTVDEKNKVVTNLAESVIYNINAVDALDKESGTQYLAGSVTAIGSESGKQVGTLTDDSTVTAITSNLGEDVKFIVEPTGYYAAEVTKTSTVASMAVEIDAIKHATPVISVKDLKTGDFVGTWDNATNTLNIANPNLVAGGASKSYELFAEVTDINSQFGVSGLFLATNAKSSKYDLGASGMTSLGNNGLTQSMINSDMKNLFQPADMKISSSDGFKSLGTFTVKLKTGQSADQLSLELYDRAKYVTIDGKAVKTGVEKDDLTNSDVGADNAKIVFANS